MQGRRELVTVDQFNLASLYGRRCLHLRVQPRSDLILTFAYSPEQLRALEVSLALGDVAGFESLAATFLADCMKRFGGRGDYELNEWLHVRRAFAKHAMNMFELAEECFYASPWMANDLYETSRRVG